MMGLEWGVIFRLDVLIWGFEHRRRRIKADGICENLVRGYTTRMMLTSISLVTSGHLPGLATRQNKI